MQAIAQMKPTISPAIAVVTTTFGLPVAASADIARTTGPALSRRCP